MFVKYLFLKRPRNRSSDNLFEADDLKLLLELEFFFFYIISVSS